MAGEWECDGVEEDDEWECDGVEEDDEGYWYGVDEYDGVDGCGDWI